MFPIWFDDEPWKLLLTGSGPSSSLFVKFHANPFAKTYEIYLTDFATIWYEFGDQALIKTNLKPYENFIDVTEFDILGVLSSILADQKVQVNIVPDAIGDNISMETRAQIGFIKFSWTFRMNTVDFKESSMYFKRTLIVPAFHLLNIVHAGSSNFNVKADKTAIQADEWGLFGQLKSKLIYKKEDVIEHVDPTPLEDNNSIDEMMTTIPEEKTTIAPLISPAKADNTNVEPAKAVDPELERRQKLQEKLKQQAEADKKKKRKLI